MKLDANVHVEKITIDPVRKYQNIISNTQALVYLLIGAIGYSQIIFSNLDKKGDIDKLQTGTAKDYMHNQSNECLNGYEFGCCTILEQYTIYKKHSLLLHEVWNVFMIRHYIKNRTKLCMYLLQLMGPQCAQFSDRIYKIMQFADKEYADFLMDLAVDSPFEYTVGGSTMSLGSVWPLQILIWNFPQLSSIIETVGEGWHPKNHEYYFIPKDKQHLQRIEPCMTTAEQNEAAYIQLSPIQEINVIVNGDIH